MTVQSSSAVTAELLRLVDRLTTMARWQRDNMTKTGVYNNFTNGSLVEEAATAIRNASVPDLAQSSPDPFVQAMAIEDAKWPAPSSWQPIETAPKDKDILAVRAEWWMPVNGNHRWVFSEIKLTRWLPLLECFASGCEKQPTHWMPAPAPPSMVPSTQSAAPACDCGFAADVCETNRCHRKQIASAGLSPVPAGYSKLPDGVVCKCFKMWRATDGSHWCCTPPTHSQTPETGNGE